MRHEALAYHPSYSVSVLGAARFYVEVGLPFPLRRLVRRLRSSAIAKRVGWHIMTLIAAAATVATLAPAAGACAAMAGISA